MTQMNNLSGETIGRYQVLERLGQGGMAEVFKAYQPSLDRYVAIKVMHAFLAREPDFMARFQREAKNVAALQHPNIIQVFDFDVHNGMPYMVMEYVRGVTLKTHLEDLNRQGQEIPLPEAIYYVREVGKALAYAHQQGMIHRDVKPANVLLGPNRRVILTDFGIAKILTGPSLTATGATVGTPSYMSPEQSLGQPGDHRSDLYALGVMLYQLATGQLPYEADTPLAVMLKHVNEPLPPPRSVRPNLPEHLERAILKALAKKPDDRFQSAEAMLAVLEAPEAAPPVPAPVSSERTTLAPAATVAAPVPHPPPAAERPTLVSPTAAPPGPRRWLLPAAGLGLLLCAGLVVAAVFAARGPLAALLAPAASTPTTPATATFALATQPPSSPTAAAPPTATRTQPPANTEPAPPSEVPVRADRLICAVSSPGGFDDQSFNQQTLVGLERVHTTLGWALATRETQSVEDYFPHLAAFVNDDCDLIVAVGFQAGDAVSAIAQAHPDERLLILDHAYSEPHPNVRQVVYAVNEAAFLAGYVAAAVSQSHVVGTFGGLNLPPVLDFMDGFVLGVRYYNDQHSAGVQVLGWDPARRDGGTFLGNFGNTDDGLKTATDMIAAGADVIMPVAGLAGFGAAEPVLGLERGYLIGVDTDWAVVAPEYRAVILTSVLKRLDVSIFQAAEAVETGTFTGGVHTGSLATDEVGLAPFYEHASLLPEAINQALSQLQAEIIAGQLPTKP